MKIFYLLLLGAICSLPIKANSPELADRHPMALKRGIEPSPTKKANIQKVTEEAKATLLSIPSKATEQNSGFSMEGEWLFKMYGYFLDQDMNVNFYGMLVGDTFLMVSYDSYIYPLKGKFDSSNNTLTITKEYVGRDWRGRYVFIYPWVPKSNGGVEPGDITAQYDPSTGILTFPEGVMLSWIDYADPAGTEDVYDEGEWYEIYSAKRSGDLDKEKPENWTSLGTATLIDGWISPRFFVDQTRKENWLHPELRQYNKKKNIYRLVNPFNEGVPGEKNDCENTGYIEFDVTDPNHVVFNRIDTGWTCREIGINKFYAYNIIGFYMQDLRESGENWETAQQFLMAYNNPDLPYTTFKDNIVDMGAMLYAGELVYDANFGDERYTAGGNVWVGFNMRSKIYFPNVDVNEPQINFKTNPSVEYDSNAHTAFISLEYTAENKPEDSYVFVMVTDNTTGRNVARKYIKTGNTCSFTLENVVPDNDYTIIVRIEGNLSEVITNSLPYTFTATEEPRELKNSGVDSVEKENLTPEYYTMQGVKVSNPAKGGIYIKVTGNKAVKVIF